MIWTEFSAIKRISQPVIMHIYSCAHFPRVVVPGNWSKTSKTSKKDILSYFSDRMKTSSGFWSTSWFISRQIFLWDCLVKAERKKRETSSSYHKHFGSGEMPILPPRHVQAELLANHSSAFQITFVFTSVLHSISIVTSVAGNLLVLIAILKKLSIREPSYALLVCLAISDLGVGLTCHPLYVVWKVDWIANGIYDRYYLIQAVLSFISTYFASVSFLTVTAVSCERYLALHYHLRYKSKKIKKSKKSSLQYYSRGFLSRC